MSVVVGVVAVAVAIAVFVVVASVNNYQIEFG